jgi:Ca2+-binding RTX toxin-like protein
MMQTTSTNMAESASATIAATQFSQFVVGPMMQTTSTNMGESASATIAATQLSQFVVGPMMQTTSTNFSVLDTTTKTPLQTNGAPYSGPVAGLQWEFIDAASDNLNVTANAPNVFVHTGSGEDAIDVSHVGGNNVLDGSTGSNFLVGGSGDDTFFVDDRSPSADIWSTVANFHAGDAATIFGITQSGFDTSWVDGQGATGFTGLTLHVNAAGLLAAPGLPTASLTLTGFTTADLSNGRISTSWGTEADGTPYLYVHANS